jgi:ubiquinone/menaquinone biosynthesis C-methylase UbiE
MPPAARHPGSRKTPAASHRPGTANPSIVRSFDWISRIYDNAVVQRLVYRANHDAVVSALRTHGATRVVDVGCGTGILAARIERELRPEVVYGCDPSEGMLEQARGRSSRVRWIQSAAEHLPLDAGTVDAVVTTEAFQFFDQPTALREFLRVLEPMGHLVIAVITPAVPLPAVVLERIPATWHTPSGMRALVEEAGFAVTDQRRLRLVGPGVATVARKPA